MDAGTPFDVTGIMLVPSLLVAEGPSLGALAMGALLGLVSTCCP